MDENKALDKLRKVMDTLLGENGCPWDKAQTHTSLRPNLLEESQEVIEAIDSADMDSLREELGDLLLQVLFHSRIAEKAGHFNLADVIDKLADKLVSRHSHIFGSDIANSPEEALALWEANKRKEKSLK